MPAEEAVRDLFVPGITRVKICSGVGIGWASFCCDAVSTTAVATGPVVPVLAESLFTCGFIEVLVTQCARPADS